MYTNKQSKRQTDTKTEKIYRHIDRQILTQKQTDIDTKIISYRHKDRQRQTQIKTETDTKTDRYKRNE
jgi:hypothetical protein